MSSITATPLYLVMYSSKTAAESLYPDQMELFLMCTLCGLRQWQNEDVVKIQLFSTCCWITYTNPDHYLYWILLKPQTYWFVLSCHFETFFTLIFNTVLTKLLTAGILMVTPLLRKLNHFKVVICWVKLNSPAGFDKPKLMQTPLINEKITI